MRELTITTPEHVNIRLEPAGSGSRFLAILIDAFITTAIASVIYTVAVNIFPRLVAAAIFVTASFLLTWGWHVYFEVKRHGRTPGKRALSLRVIDARGLPVTLYQSIVRNATRMVDFLPVFYGVGGLVSMLRRDRRRLGDVLADTLVIRESQPLAYRGELGAELHGPAQDVFGVGAPPQATQHEGQIEVDLDLLGPQLDRLSIRRFRVRVPPLSRPRPRPPAAPLKRAHTIPL